MSEKASANGARYKRMRVSAELFLDLFSAGFHSGGYSVRADPMPADTKLVHVRHSWPNDIELLLSSESFPVCKIGEEIPLLVPILRKEYPTISLRK